MLPALIDAAENEFTQMIEEEIQRRIKEQEAQDHHDKMKKSPKIHKKQDENETSQDSDIVDQQEEAPTTNGTRNGHHESNGTANGHNHENGNGHAEN